MKPILLVLVASLSVGACSDPSSGSAQPDTYQALCQAQCDRSLRCITDATAPLISRTCVADCVAAGPASNVFKPGVLSSLAGCFAGLACGNDDSCTTQAIVAQNPNWQQDPEYHACLTKRTDCQASGAGFSDDQCIAVFLVTDSVRSAFNACIAGVCSTIQACIDTAFGG
jgi:hypothetical protein